MYRLNLRAIHADITQIDADAIVNAANEALIPGGGVDGAINRAAGFELAVAMRDLRGCPTGEARITAGYQLRAKYVIHAVGPVWRGGDHDEARLLAGAYLSALNLAHEHGCGTVAFPAISTGVYGYPAAEATRIAVATCRGFGAEAGPVHTVLFACFSPEMLTLYHSEGVATLE
jgi:O-acetyl-ADP-ribose deacetylase